MGGSDNDSWVYKLMFDIIESADQKDITQPAIKLLEENCFGSGDSLKAVEFTLDCIKLKHMFCKEELVQIHNDGNTDHKWDIGLDGKIEDPEARAENRAYWEKEAKEYEEEYGFSMRLPDDL